MELDPAKLEAILELLLELGVQEFEGYGFHVRFKEEAMPKEKEAVTIPDRTKVTAPARYPDPRGIWNDPALWPDGRPPTFPSDE